MDTVGRIVLSSLSELEQNVIFVSSNPKITVICFSSWLLCGRKKKTASFVASSSSWKLCTWEKISVLPRLDTPIHSHPCTQADFPPGLSVKKCSCFEVRKVHITATILGDPGATSWDDAIFSVESLLQELKSPWELILTKPVPEVVNSVPLIGQKNIFSTQSAMRSSRVTLWPSYTK